MTPSVFLCLFVLQALLSQLLTPCIQLLNLLFVQITFAICDLFFHIAGIGIYQRVQHDLRRVQQKDAVPFLTVRLPSQQRIAVAGRSYSGSCRRISSKTCKIRSKLSILFAPLTENQFRQYRFLSLCFQCVHQAYPSHLICGF